MIALWVTAASFGALVAVWFGYPCVLWCVSLIAGRPLRAERTLASSRTVSVILATRDRANIIRARVQNLLETAHPAQRMEIVIALDAQGGDASVEELTNLDPRVRVIVGDQPGGKAAALNAGVRAATGEIVVLADAQQRFDRQTIPELVAALEDERFGAVSGALQLPEGGAGTWPIRIYWRLEKWLRHREAIVHSSIGVTGAVYAIGRRHWPPIPPGVLLDDLFVPLTLIVNGLRVGFCYEAIAIESRVFEARQERSRKTRTLTGVLQLPHVIPGLFDVRRNPVLLQLFMHKFARLLTPFLLAVGVGAGGLALIFMLAGHGAQVAVILLLSVALLAAISPLRRVFVSSLRWMVEMQIATGKALHNAARHRWDVWSR